MTENGFRKLDRSAIAWIKAELARRKVNPQGKSPARIVREVLAEAGERFGA